MAGERLRHYMRRHFRGRTYIRRLPLRRRPFRKSGGEPFNTRRMEGKSQCELVLAKRSFRSDEKPCAMDCNILVVPFASTFIMPSAAFAWSSMMEGRA